MGGHEQGTGRAGTLMQMGLAHLLPVALAGAALVACGTDPGSHVASPVADAGTAEASTASLCQAGTPADWPPGPYDVSVLSTLPKDLVFEGPNGPVRLSDAFEPCAERSRVLVIRTTAAFCGTCAWHVEHTARLLGDPQLAGRLKLVDLVVSDEDNMPATPASAARWAARIDAPGQVGVDPAYTFAKAQLPNSPLPTYTLVDTKTMQVMTTATDPSPEALHDRIAILLAQLDGAPRPASTLPVLVAGFTENQWAMVQAMQLAPGAAPPPDPTNAYGDVPAAAALGKSLFEDAALSPSGTVACATCHLAEKDFTDGAAQSTGLVRIDRNAPSVSLAAHSRWQFWDGRADTLWAQALGPFEDPREMGSSRLFVAQQIAARYATEYDAVFGAAYPRPDLSSAPAGGKPGDAAYDALPAATRDAVTRMYVNAGKAIAAFERSLRVQPNALDRFAQGQADALTPPQRMGLATFFKVGCAQCHFGPRLTNDAFHVIRFPTGRQDRAADRGRIDVLATLATREFAATTAYSDAPNAAKNLLLDPASAPRMLGAFKTPSLRGLPATGPYGHGGSFATLAEVTRHYGGRGLLPPDPHAVGETEEWVPRFDPSAQQELVPFLEVLTADLVP